MFTPDQYELLDFGEGRKLERLGSCVVDRPAPAATGRRARPTLWSSAARRFQRTNGERGEWRCAPDMPATWHIRHRGRRAVPDDSASPDFDTGFTLQLKANEFGHVGVFPEQAANWDWLAEAIRSAGRRLRVLNLFAYTGGSTLAAVRAGAEVAHVDAAKNVVAWARRNAELSGLAEAPIRWLAEDALRFVQRELRRGNRYDAVILDPPSYGHGPKGEPWKLERDLPRLLAACAELTVDSRAFLLLTCHSPELAAQDLKAMLAESLGGSAHRGTLVTEELALVTSCDRLPAGQAAKWVS